MRENNKRPVRSERRVRVYPDGIFACVPERAEGRDNFAVERFLTFPIRLISRNAPARTRTLVFVSRQLRGFNVQTTDFYGNTPRNEFNLGKLREKINKKKTTDNRAFSCF